MIHVTSRQSALKLHPTLHPGQTSIQQWLPLGFYSPQKRNIGFTKSKSTELIEGFSLTDDRWNISTMKENKMIKICSLDYILKDSILRQHTLYSNQQDQTKDAFDFKWKKRETYESRAVQDSAHAWLVERYLGGDPARRDVLLKPGLKVLDAGCGAGVSAMLFFSEYLNSIHYLGADISAAVDVAQQRFVEKGLHGEFIQADLMHLPFEKPAFDLIFSERVLHHTDSTEEAIKYLSSLLLPGGKFLFYVYNQKGPIHEFTDDYIRDCLKGLTDQQAWDSLIPLTKLGKTLGDLNITIDVPEAIPFLDIPSGKISIQRFIYWHVFKAFYRPEFSLDEMNHANFDWYRPLNCHRQTPDQIKTWCANAGLIIEDMNIQEAGIIIVAKKQNRKNR